MNNPFALSVLGWPSGPTVPNPPAAPTGLDVTRVGNDYIWTWNAVSGADSYDVRHLNVDPGFAGGYTTLVVVDPVDSTISRNVAGTTDTLTELEMRSFYYATPGQSNGIVAGSARIEVRARNAGGVSSYTFAFGS